MGNILPERQDLKDDVELPKVIEPSVLVTVGERMVNTAIAEDVAATARTRDMMCQWNLDGLLNIVSEDSFFNMVSAALGGMRKTLLNSQPNGDWQPQEHEFEIRPGRQDKPELFMGIRWIDVKDEEDIIYGNNWQPIVNVNVNRNESDDDDLKEILKLLAKKQVSNDVLIDALQHANDTANQAKAEATEEPAPTPKKTRKVKR